MQLTPLNFRDIGIAVYKLDPELALRYLAKHEEPKPLETDLNKIPTFFSRYCAHKKIDGINSKVHTKTEYVYLRHVFMAVIIKLYNPELLNPILNLRMKRQLRVALARTMKTHVTWISQTSNTVILRLKIYRDFEDDVIETIQAIKNVK